MPFTVSVRKNLIPQVQLAIADRSTVAVRANAQAVQALCEVNSPRRTGALSASWYRNGPNGESDYGLHETAARALNPAAHIVPELQSTVAGPNGTQRDVATGKFTHPQALVASAVEYSLYLEEGTVHMAPHPTLRPSALIVEKLFVADMMKVADGF